MLTNTREQEYQVKIDSTYDKAGVRIKHPGWDAMRGIYERCADITRNHKYIGAYPRKTILPAVEEFVAGLARRAA